jgi:PEP-CTERM motif
MADRFPRAKAVSLVLGLALLVGSASTAAAISVNEFADAGNLPGTSQAAGVLPVLTQITGTIGSSTDADMFAITIGFQGLFSATTVGTGGTLSDTQLFLFDSTGHGLLANDDSTGFRSTLPPTLLSPALYFVAISGYNRDPVSGGGLIFPNSPFSSVFGPTGPGGASAITGWQGTGSTGTYAINLQLEPVPEPATLVLFGTALAGIGAARRRQRKRQ